MAKRQSEERITRYHDTTARHAPGDVQYVIDLTDEDVEKLASGRAPTRVIEACWRMLAWKREAAQDWGSFK
jgi:hypothetical protein